MVDDCFKSKSPSIAVIQREKGAEFTEGLLGVWLMNLNEILNLNKPMTEAQIVLCVAEIMSNYPMLKIIDLTLLFKRIMAGEFGEFYESLSIPKVLTFFKSYSEDRMNRAAYLSQEEHKDRKSNDAMNISNNWKRRLQGVPKK